MENNPAVMNNEPAINKNLDGFFKSRSVAVIGASSNPAKIGYQILNNIISGGYQGEIYPINPKDTEILGKKAYKSVLEIPGEVDFVVITIPQPLVIPAMEECAKKGVTNAAIITSGFSEVGSVEDEQKLKEIADKNGIHFIGPNILGFLYLPDKLNASFGPQDNIDGKIAFISQSGALAIALMGWTVMEKIGFGSLVSLGNKADIDEKDLIEYFNTDENIDVVLIYMEGLSDGRRFMKTKVEKPVIILKVGRSKRGAKAAASHTGSLAGSDGIFDAAFKQLGILRADSFTEAFGWARAFALPLPKGDNAIIITNGGGIGVSGTDVCEQLGIKLLEEPEWLEEKFRKTMPSYGSTKNPIDITGGAGVDGYQQTLNIALTEDKLHEVIVLYCETAVTDPMDIAKAVVEEYDAVDRNKPIVVAMVGGERSRAAIHFLSLNDIPAFDSVNDAISAMKVLHTWDEYCREEKDVPDDTKAPQEVIDMIEKIKAEGREVMMEHEARRVMELCGVPTSKAGFATTLEEAIEQANSKDMYPLAMKITSPDILHKTDVGGVALNIASEEGLKIRYQKMMDNVKKAAPDADILGVNLVQMVSGIECIIGMTQDSQFGPVIMFGLGGVFVEALKDVTFRIVPFGKVEAARLIGDIKAKKVLEGFRGMKAHKESLIQTMCAIQKLAPYVKEIDINPIMTNDDGSYAVDARIIL